MHLYTRRTKYLRCLERASLTSSPDQHSQNGLVNPLSGERGTATKLWLSSANAELDWLLNAGRVCELFHTYENT